jgi:hypothetical protein
MTRARGARVGLGPVAARIDHRDAIHRAGRQTEVATGAARSDHRVHALRRADDRIDRTRIDAERTADAQRLVDDGDLQWPFAPVRRIQRQVRPLQQRGKLRDADCAAGRALVDLGAAGDRLRIRAAALVAALRALRLRQQRVDVLDKGHGFDGG